MASSAGQFSSFATPLPTCDAWGHIKTGTSVQSAVLMNSANVSTVSRIGVGEHGITFTSPTRFGGGAYVTIFTPEVSSWNSPCVLYSKRGAVGSTGAGKTSGIVIESWGFDGAAPGGNTASKKDFAFNSLYINFASFHFSKDSELRNPAGGTLDAVPGSGGYGVTGATYNSHIASLLSRRTATAYGTIVIPPVKGNSSTVTAYVENEFNVRGVSATANSTFDVFFDKAGSGSDYCVILSSEVEPTDTRPNQDWTQLLEYPIVVVDRTFKDGNGFRIVSLRQNSPNNDWYRASTHYQLGLTERIHFMVFGAVGATFGQL